MDDYEHSSRPSRWGRTWALDCHRHRVGRRETIRRGRNAPTVEIEREEDGRWIAEVPDLAGVLVYGESRDQAVARAEALALRVLADRLEHDEAGPDLFSVSFRAA